MVKIIFTILILHFRIQYAIFYASNMNRFQVFKDYIPLCSICALVDRLDPLQFTNRQYA